MFLLDHRGAVLPDSHYTIHCHYLHSDLMHPIVFKRLRIKDLSALHSDWLILLPSYYYWTVWNGCLYGYGLQYYQRLHGYTGEILDD